MPIPERGPHRRSFGCSGLSTKLGLNYNRDITNSVVTRVMVWSAKARRNERLKLCSKAMSFSV